MHNTVRKIPPIPSLQAAIVSVMDSEIRRRALRAAAKVVFGAAFVGALPGCGGKAEFDSATPMPSGGDPSAAPSDPSLGHDAGPATPAADAAVPAVPTDLPPVNSGLRCLPPVELGSGSPATPSTQISDATYACCVQYDTERLSSLQDAGLAGSIGSDPSFVNCCRAIIARSDTGAPPDPSPVRQACCYGGVLGPASELWGHQFCAPWGPPVPPALFLPLEISA
jgi:hypothetical protein